MLRPRRNVCAAPLAPGHPREGGQAPDRTPAADALPLEAALLHLDTDFELHRPRTAPAMERSRARRRDEWSSSHPAATRASTPVAAPPRERQARCACKSPGIGLPAGTGGSRNCGKAGPRTGRSRRQARRRCGRLRKWRGPGLSAPRAGDLLCRSGGTSTTMPEADGGLPIVVRVPGTYPGGSCGTDAHRAGLGKRRVARANGRPTAEHRGGCPDGRSACELNRCRGRAAPR